MAKIHAMLDIGKRSMMNSQTALQTVAHNIANKTTEGYSRQRVDQVTNEPITEGKLQLGMGARAATVSRTNNPFLDKQLQVETGMMGFHTAQSDAMGRVEQIFNEQMNKGINQYMTDFFNAYRELSNNPESNTSRVVVKETAQALTKDFKRVDDHLERVQAETDMEVKQTVGDINAITKEIAGLNQKIAAVELQGNAANDERDRRDVLVKHLQEKIDVHISDGDNGMIGVATAGNALLVTGNESANLKTYPEPEDSRIRVLFQSGDLPAFDITSRIHGGRLGGALEIRDQLIPDLRDKISDLAVQLANDVNAAHVRGFDRQGRQCGMFFEFGNAKGNAAANIKVTDEISSDITRIGAAANQNAPADNTVANVISALQHKHNMNGGTMDDFYNAQVGRVGVVANSANKAREAQEHTLEQVNNLRESVSGVSLDEEATKMIEYQKAFEASARVIRTADEMFDTILNLKRL